MATSGTVHDRKLRLKVNEAKSAVARPEERHFLGFRLRREPEDGTVEVDLSKRSKERVDEKIRSKTRRNRGQSLWATLRELNAYLRGWIGFFWIVTGKTAERTLQNLDAHIRRRLRAVLLKHWRSKRSIARRLIKLGCPPKKAWRTALRGATTPLGSQPNVRQCRRGLRNEYFEERGCVSLEARGAEVGAQSRPGTAPSGAGTGIAAGAQALAPAYRASAPTPVSRRAGCEIHKSGSVGAGGGQPPLATRRQSTIRSPPVVPGALFWRAPGGAAGSQGLRSRRVPRDAPAPVLAPTVPPGPLVSERNRRIYTPGTWHGRERRARGVRQGRPPPGRARPGLLDGPEPGHSHPAGVPRLDGRSQGP